MYTNCVFWRFLPIKVFLCILSHIRYYIDETVTIATTSCCFFIPTENDNLFSKNANSNKRS